MDTKRFASEKMSIINKLDSLRQMIERTTYDDACKIASKYHADEDPLGVALHDMFYQQITRITYDNSL